MFCKFGSFLGYWVIARAVARQDDAQCETQNWHPPPFIKCICPNMFFAQREKRASKITACSSLMWQPDVKRQTSATAWDSLKFHISTVSSAQHPNAGQNIQLLVVSKLIFSSLSWVLEIWFCEVATSSLFFFFFFLSYSFSKSSLFSCAYFLNQFNISHPYLKKIIQVKMWNFFLTV